VPGVYYVWVTGSAVFQEDFASIPPAFANLSRSAHWAAYDDQILQQRTDLSPPPNVDTGSVDVSQATSLFLMVRQCEVETNKPFECPVSDRAGQK
jgi:hypothetical protein